MLSFVPFVVSQTKNNLLFFLWRHSSRDTERRKTTFSLLSALSLSRNRGAYISLTRLLAKVIPQEGSPLASKASAEHLSPTRLLQGNGGAAVRHSPVWQEKRWKKERLMIRLGKRGGAKGVVRKRLCEGRSERGCAKEVV